MFLFKKHIGQRTGYIVELFVVFIFFFVLCALYSATVNAAASCALAPTSGNALIGKNGYFDVKVSGISGTVGNYTVEMRFPGSDPILSPGKQDWTGGLFCHQSVNSPDRCSAGAIYSQNGCFVVETRIKDDLGYHNCASINLDVCSVSTVADFTLISGSNESVSKSFGTDYICGAFFDNIGWRLDNNSFYQFPQNGIPGGKLEVVQTGDGMSAYDWGYFAGYGAPVCYKNNCPEYGYLYGPIDYIRKGVTSKQITWKLSNLNLEGHVLETDIFGISVLHRSVPAGCPAADSCEDKPICNQISYQKTDGTWSSGDFNIVSGQSIKLRCSYSNGEPSSWTWSAQLPSQKINSYTNWTTKKQHLGSWYDLSNTNRYEQFITPNNQGSGFLLYKINTKISWTSDVKAIYPQIYKSDGKMLWQDDPILRIFNPYPFYLTGSQNGKVVAFNFEGNDLSKPVLNSNTTYKLALRLSTDKPFVGYWWNSDYPNYNNFFEVYATPNIQGTFSPEDRNSSEITWTVPNGVIGQTFTISSKTFNSSCGWVGWGDEIKGTVN